MSNASTDAAFSGAIPKIYERFLVPMLFQFYADDIAKRVAARSPMRVLELAAGTGVVTRAMTAVLPETAAIVSTDLNQAMIDEAAALHTGRPVERQQADATHLPFADSSFDIVVCEFGVMFFPDKYSAYAEALRVLRAGGAFIFSVWGSLDDNEIADAVARGLMAAFPEDPPMFLQRSPYGYHSQAAIAADLAKAGYSGKPVFHTIEARAKAPEAHAAAVGFCQGTPLRAEIEARSPAGLGTTTVAVAEAVARKLGTGKLDTKMLAVVVEAVKL
jgi:SAM-dependent methyltransferase